MSDEDLEIQRVAGEIILLLKHSSDDEKESFLQYVGKLAGPEEEQRIREWILEGMEGA